MAELKFEIPDGIGEGLSSEPSGEGLASQMPIPFLDQTGQDLLREARANFLRLGPGERQILTIGRTTHLVY